MEVQASVSPGHQKPIHHALIFIITKWLEDKDGDSQSPTRAVHVQYILPRHFASHHLRESDLIKSSAHCASWCVLSKDSGAKPHCSLEQPDAEHMEEKCDWPSGVLAHPFDVMHPWYTLIRAHSTEASPPQ